MQGTGRAVTLFDVGVTGALSDRRSHILHITIFYILKPAGICTTHCYIKELCSLPHCVFVIHVICMLNTKYIPLHHKLIILCNGNDLLKFAGSNPAEAVGFFRA
jgi:hypothetical protein